MTLAYAELVSSDYLTAQGRSGYFVSDSGPVAPELPAWRRGPRRWILPRLSGARFSGRGGVERPEDWESYPYPFIYGQADAEPV